MVVQQRDAQIGNPVINSVFSLFASDSQSSRASAPAPAAAPSYQQPQSSYQQPQSSYQPPQQSYQPPQQSYQPPQQSYQQSYQPPQQSYQPPQQPQQSFQPPSRAPSSGVSGGNYTVDTSRFNQVPISAIHPYLDRNWFIRVALGLLSPLVSRDQQELRAFVPLAARRGQAVQRGPAGECGGGE